MQRIFREPLNAKGQLTPQAGAAIFSRRAKHLRAGVPETPAASAGYQRLAAKCKLAQTEPRLARNTQFVE